MPNHPGFGGGLSETLLHPLVLVALLIGLVLIFLLPRKYLIFPVLILLILIPLGQQVYAAGVHFFVLRIVILFGFIRFLFSSLTSQESTFSGGMNSVDRLFLVTSLTQGMCVILLNMQAVATVNMCGFFLDTIGGYILLRFLIRNEEDIYRTIKCFAIIAMVLAIGMSIEHFKLVNIFGLLKGVNVAPEVRDGRVRSQGVFQHSILAGCFGATLLPLFFLLWKNTAAKFIAFVGLASVTIMTVTSASSTPLLAYAAGIAAVCFWPLRKKMRTVRWAIVFGLVALAIVMKAPIWFLISHIDLTGSSSGYQRAEVVDQFIRHFRDWWLMGTKDTANWGWDMWDTQNEYVYVGQMGGLLALATFIAMISRCFGRLGRAVKLAEENGAEERLFWFIGAALFAHCTAFFGVNYFDQTKMSWFALLVMVSAATSPILARERVRVPEWSAISTRPEFGRDSLPLPAPRVARSGGR